MEFLLLHFLLLNTALSVVVAVFVHPLLGLLVFTFLYLVVLYIIVGKVRVPFHHSVHTASIPDKRLPDVVGHATQLYGEKINNPQTDFELPYEDIEIVVPPKNKTGEPAHTLRGWHIPARNRTEPGADTGILCLHGAGRDRRAFLRHSPSLHAAGYGVALLDMREHGLSDRDYMGMTYGPREAADVLSMVAHMRGTLGYRHVITVGTSTGASASIIAAAAANSAGSPQWIDALVCECPFESREAMLLANIVKRLGRVPRILSWIKRWTAKMALAASIYSLPSSRSVCLNKSPLVAVSQITERPIFFMHGGCDNMVDASHSRHLFAEARFPKSIWISPKAHHTALFDTAKDEWESRVLDFISASLALSRNKKEL
jgi:pimeloyl-ACP methyl ester carboxylesterase